jgi:hypothetical protein
MTTTPTSRMKSFMLSGGWVLIGSAILFIAVMVWALAPAVLRMTNRPPGDGASLHSYQFDLSNLRLPETAVLETAMLHRDMVPTLDSPIEILTAQEVEDVAGTRAKYLVSNDPVVGVTIGDQSRAYPISMLHVHELVHDEIGGVPIVVTWHWPSASPRVFDRRINGDTRNFGVSGLVAGGNMVLYPRNLDGHIGDEPLISQLLGRSITGPEMKIDSVPARFTNWHEWLQDNPDTTVAGRDAALKKRYRHADPAAYYISGGLIYDTPVLPDEPDAKSPVLLLDGPTPLVVRHNSTTGFDPPGPWKLVPPGGGNPPRIERTSSEATTDVRHSLWHSAHALGLTPLVP